VIKELRRGYTWKGRLLRCAEVQAVSAARGATAPAPAPGPAESGPDDDGRLDAQDDGEAATDFDIETDLTPEAARTEPD
jgi:hypothetical protein